MDTISPSTHSPASVSLPVSPDDDSRFDRTASPSPACPKETLQQCGVSRIVKIHFPVLTCSAPTANSLTTRALINFLEQAAPLGYKVLNLTGNAPSHIKPSTHKPSDPFLYNDLEHMTTASRALGYFNSITTNGLHLHSQRAAPILQNLDHVTISIGGKPETHDHLHQQRGAFARMQESLTILKDKTNFGFTHTLHKNSWQILSWLTDFAMQHKATLLHLGLSTPTNSTWSAIDLYRIYISHYYLRTFAEPELLIQLDLLHRDNIIDNPNFFFHQDSVPETSVRGFFTLFKELVITERGDILPIGRDCSDFFRIGNIHDREPLSNMVEQFVEKKLNFVTQLFNETYSNILRDRSTEILNLTGMVIQKTYEFSEAAPTPSPREPVPLPAGADPLLPAGAPSPLPNKFS